MIRNKANFYHSLPAGFDGEFDWDFLIPAFEPTKIQPMDIDGIVERNGHFLVFETKDEGKDIPVGQSITLNALHQLGVFTLFFLYGKNKQEFTKFEIAWPNTTEVLDIDLKDNPKAVILEYTKKWFYAANRKTASKVMDYWDRLIFQKIDQYKKTIELIEDLKKQTN